jgi:deazaflavin-dependent oxidoreductase (nitroreductase family)
MVKILNPLIRKVAGKRFMSMAALVSHTGRRSGKHYSTPVGAHVRGNDCLMPLTFGSESDWSENLRAAGSGKMRWKGRDFEVSAPEVRRAEDIKPLVKELFRAPERLGFKMLGIKSFLYLRAVPVLNESVHVH